MKTEVKIRPFKCVGSRCLFSERAKKSDPPKIKHKTYNPKPREFTDLASLDPLIQRAR